MNKDGAFSKWTNDKEVSKGQAAEMWELRLYIAGQTQACVSAFENLRKICEEYLAGRYHIEVIDLYHNPQLAQVDQIVAIPTLVRKSPEPVRKLIGNLSNTQKTMTELQIHPPRRK